jgi:hypothetical protein
MHTPATSPKRLTPYEAAQVESIARWKSTQPSPFAEIVRNITLPVANLCEKFIPDRLANSAIVGASRVAELTAGHKDIEHRAGVSNLTELRNKHLEECDRLAARVGAIALVWATAQGALTGFFGAITTLVDIPLAITLSLRTIRRIGFCYGYTLDHPHDRTLVLRILITATAGSLATKRRRLDQVREFKHVVIEETEEEIIADEAISFLFQLEVFEALPGIGAISGALLNLAFMRRVEVTATRVFQERWLEDCGKVHAIKPAPVHARRLATGWRATFDRAVIAGTYSVGYAVALPVCFMGGLFRPASAFSSAP